MAISVSPIKLTDTDAFREVLNSVAQERKFLPRFAAPPRAQVEDFVRQNLEMGRPQFLAFDNEKVVGWCDIIPKKEEARQHCGVLGIGLLQAYRGQGIGTRLLDQTIQAAKAIGLTRIELKVRASNHTAIRLYKKSGFVAEGTLKNDILDNGRFEHTTIMALIVEERPAAP